MVALPANVPWVHCVWRQVINLSAMPSALVVVLTFLFIKRKI